MGTLLNRPEYLRQLIGHRDVDLVKIITGIRRCGKSSLLELFRQYLLADGVPASNIIHINFESFGHWDLTDAAKLYAYVRDHLPPEGRTYLLFDEIQTVGQWERAVESFRLDFDVDIYITGSNARFLSTEFSTLLSGRYVELSMLPLSFKEFLAFHRFDSAMTIEDKFHWYLQIGGLPALREYALDKERCLQAVEGVYSTIVLRDILQRNPQLNQATLRKIMAFLCDNIGNITSPNRMGGVLAHEGDIKAANGKTVSRYLAALESAFIAYPVARYDVKGRQLLKTLGKHYLADLSFRNLLLGYHESDRGHALENIVYLELLRRGYRVFIGKVGAAEIDFLAQRSDEKLYVQVTEAMLSPETRERELRPLRGVGDSHQKLLLSLDRDYAASYDGIRSVNLLDWLLD